LSPTTLRTLIGLVLLVHGIGHVMALLPALNITSTEKWHHRSWLLNNILGDTASRIIVVVLFGAATIGFIGAALSLFGWLLPHEYWRTLGTVSAVISLIALALFWNSFAALFPNKIGAIAVDAAVLVCLLWLNWPSEASIGY